jgi:hypothetical protein
MFDIRNSHHNKEHMRENANDETKKSKKKKNKHKIDKINGSPHGDLISSLKFGIQLHGMNGPTTPSPITLDKQRTTTLLEVNNRLAEHAIEPPGTFNHNKEHSSSPQQWGGGKGSSG